ncbi:response regulator transcription factor [Kosakonia sacchari]|uniref:response regulator transcription factor n=1 Tax=Kosakonia sacchari TaxID=1158459 RepID=UPI0025B19962|nr:response regulator transcription factor [Kosakonia sacchari]MDN2487675.1 response regulator transcription factor [Kosakonia sacchari]
MLSKDGNQGIIISKTPVLRVGIGGILERHFPEYALNYYSSVEEVAPLKLKCARLIITDLSGEQRYARKSCQQYYSLFPQCDNARWLFFVSRSLYPVAAELLMQPKTTLLADVEPIEGVIDAIRNGHKDIENISQTLLTSGWHKHNDNSFSNAMLTLSERKVLRLLGKGWGINQIATLLKKSNKTVSAQKNSAMRRLSLRSNADLYTWINSSQGMKQLDFGTADGEHNEWKIPGRKEILPS